MNRTPLLKIAAFLRGLLSVFIALLLAVILFLTIISATLYKTLLPYDTYAGIIQQTRLAERIRGDLAGLLFSTGLKARSASVPTYLNDVSQQNWESVAEVILPVPWIEQALSQNLPLLLAWLDSTEPGFPAISIDLKPVKEALAGPDGAMAILPLLQNVPPCPPGETIKIVLYGPTSLLSCWPEEKSLIEPAATIAQDTSAILTDRLVLLGPEGGNLAGAELLDPLVRLRKSLSMVRAWNVAGLRLSLFLISLYCLLNSASLLRLLRAWPYPFYATAVFLFLFILAWHAFSEWGLGPLLTGTLSGARVELQSLLLDCLRGLTSILERVWLPYAAILLLQAAAVHVLAAWLTGWTARKNVQKQAAPRSVIGLKKQMR